MALTKTDDLRRFHIALDAAGFDHVVAPTLGALIAKVGNEAFPPGEAVLRDFQFNGWTFLVDISDRFGCSCFFSSSLELKDSVFFSSLCRPGDVVWDIGANFGLYTVAAASRVGAQGRVIAVEPSTRARDFLIANIEANGHGLQTTVVPCAVTDRDGEAVFFDATETAFSGLSDTKRSKLSSTSIIPVRTLGSLAEEYGVSHIDMMKIDVEGHELDVLLGAVELIVRSPEPLIQLEISSKNIEASKENALHRLLKQLAEGDMTFWMVGGRGNGHEALDPMLADFMQRAQGNLMMTKKGSLRENELLAASRASASRAGRERSAAEEALLFTLSAIVQREKEGKAALVRDAQLLKKKLATKQLQLETLLQGAPLPSRAILGPRRALQPYALAELGHISVIIRVTTDDRDVAATVDSARQFCNGAFITVMIADCRSEPDSRSISAGVGMLIQPPLQLFQATSHQNRYQHATLAALKAATGSHVLLIEAGKQFNADVHVDLLVKYWKHGAGKGLAIAACVLPTVGDADEHMGPELGDTHVIRDGLISLTALRALDDSTPHFTGRTIDADLALQLRGAGFSLLQAPEECALSRSPGTRLLLDMSTDDRAVLVKRWQGGFVRGATEDVAETPTDDAEIPVGA